MLVLRKLKSYVGWTVIAYLATVTVTLGFTQETPQQMITPGQPIRICIGEYEELCPSKRNAWFPCGTKAEDAARSVCTVWSTGGKTVAPFKIFQLYDVPGNKCGYLGIDVLCIGQ